MLFILCGIIYCSIELLWRGYTHVSMFLLAGLLGVFCIDTPNNIYGYDLDYLIQIIISTIFCTFGEGICGLIVNVWVNYSDLQKSELPASTTTALITMMRNSMSYTMSTGV